MATCTLDDLVPRLVCDNIYLEPIQAVDVNGVGTGGINYGEYEIVINMSVLDTFDEHGEGIADYLLSENYKKYFSIESWINSVQKRVLAITKNT